MEVAPAFDAARKFEIVIQRSLEEYSRQFHRETGYTIDEPFNKLRFTPNAHQAVFFVIKNSEKEAASKDPFLANYLRYYYSEDQSHVLCMIPSWSIMQSFLDYLSQSTLPIATLNSNSTANTNFASSSLVPVMSSAIQNRWKHGLLRNQKPFMIRLHVPNVLERVEENQIYQDFRNAMAATLKSKYISKQNPVKNTPNFSRLQRMLEKVEKATAFLLYLPIILGRLLRLQAAVLLSDFKAYKKCQEVAKRTVVECTEKPLNHSLSNILSTYRRLVRV